MHKLVTFVAATAATVALVVAGATAAQAETAADSSNEAPLPTLEFGWMPSQSFIEVLDSIRENNDPDDIARVLERAIETDGGVALGLPGTAELTPTSTTELLEDSLQAVESGSELRTDVPLAEPSGGPVIAPALGRSGRGASVQTALLVRNSGPQVQTAASILLASASDASVFGAPVNNNMSWQWQDRFNWSECAGGCRIVSWIDFRLTTDPGKTTAKTSLNFNRWGTKLGSVRITSDVLRAGRNVNSSQYTWSTPGSGVQWNTGIQGMNGATFQEYYWIEFASPGGWTPYEYKTGKSKICSEPTPGAFSCKFA